jgi:hypothetical protein
MARVTERLDYESQLEDAGICEFDLDSYRDIQPRKLKIKRTTTKPKHITSITSMYFCRCNLCELQSQGKIPTAPAEDIGKDELAETEGFEVSFTWLLEQMGESACSTPMKINIPDTVVFRKGKPSFMIHNAKDRNLKYYNSGEKLKLHEIMKNFTKVVRFRKREEVVFLTSPKLQKLRSSNTSLASYPADSPITSYGRETALLKYMSRSKDNEMNDLKPKDEEGPLRVMMENEFIELMFERGGSPIWKSIAYLQTVVKCKHGINEPILVTHYAHKVHDYSAIEELQKAAFVDEEDDMGYSRSPEEYCMMVCRKIAYYLAVYCHYNLLRMRGEFIKDDNGRIWLIGANKISVSSLELVENDNHILFKRVGLMNSESKETLMQQVNLISKIKLNSKASKLAEAMNEHYENLKRKVGLDSVFTPKPPDNASNYAFAKLRPLTPYRFDQLVDPKQSNEITDKLLHERPNRGHNRRTSSWHDTSKIVVVRSSRATPIREAARTSQKWIYKPRIVRSPLKTRSQSQAGTYRSASRISNQVHKLL